MPSSDNYSSSGSVETVNDTARSNGNGSHESATNPGARFLSADDHLAYVAGQGNRPTPIPDRRRPQEIRDGHAVASPFPRPRDRQKNDKPRTIIFDAAVPKKGELYTAYRDAVGRIGRNWPMRAAVLSDMIMRVDSAIDRYQVLTTEDEKTRTSKNALADRRDEEIDTQVKALRDERAVIESVQDDVVAERRATLAAARMNLAEQLALSEIPVRLQDWGAYEDPEMLTKSPALGQQQQAVVEGSAGALVPASAATTQPSKSTLPGVLGQGLQELLSRRGAAESAMTLQGQVLGAAGQPQPYPQQYTTFGAAASGFGQSSASGAEPPIIREEFPAAEASQRAKPEQVIALETGMPVVGAADEVFPHAGRPGQMFRLATAAVTIVCGAIFGTSVGLLLGLLNTTALSLGATHQAWIMLACSIFGTALFWGLGKTIQGITSLVAEEVYTSLLATNHGDRDAAGQWFRKAGMIAAIVMGTMIVGLILIEATVERFGIVKLFIDSASNAMLLGKQAAPAPPSAFATICLTLIASAPFAMLHATEGWVRTKSRLLSSNLAAGRVQSAWEIASKLQTERLQRRLAAADAEFVREQKEREETRQTQKEETVRAREAALKHIEAASVAATSTASLPQGAPQSDDIEGEFTVEDDNTPDISAASPLLHGDAALKWKLQQLALPVALAKTNEGAREAYARLREAYARRRDSLAWHDSRMAALESSRYQHETEASTDSRRRVEDAYEDVIGSIREFDRQFARDSREYERWARGGVWTRFVAVFFGKAEVS